MSALPVRVLGIDPGITATGYAVVVFGGSEYSVTAAGVVKPRARRPTPERLKVIYDTLAAVVSEHDPHVVAVESAFFSPSTPVATKIAEVIGVVKLLAQGRRVLTFSPLQVKKQICGHGNAPKEQISTVVKALVAGDEAEKEAWPEHVTDAIAVALCGLWAGNWGEE